MLPGTLLESKEASRKEGRKEVESREGLTEWRKRKPYCAIVRGTCMAEGSCVGLWERNWNSNLYEQWCCVKGRPFDHHHVCNSYPDEGPNL